MTSGLKPAFYIHKELLLFIIIYQVLNGLKAIHVESLPSYIVFQFKKIHVGFDQNIFECTYEFFQNVV